MGVILQICVVRLCATILAPASVLNFAEQPDACCFFLLALPQLAPAHRAGQNCRGSQRPRSDYGQRRVFHRAVLRSEFLPQRISTRAGVSAAAVDPQRRAARREPLARKSAAPRTASTRWRAHEPRRAPVHSAMRRALHPANGVKFFTLHRHFHFSSSSRHARAPRHVAQHLELGQQ